MQKRGQCSRLSRIGDPIDHRGDGTAADPSAPGQSIQEQHAEDGEVDLPDVGVVGVRADALQQNGKIRSEFRLIVRPTHGAVSAAQCPVGEIDPVLARLPWILPGQNRRVGKQDFGEQPIQGADVGATCLPLLVALGVYPYRGRILIVIRQSQQPTSQGQVDAGLGRKPWQLLGR